MKKMTETDGVVYSDVRFNNLKSAKENLNVTVSSSNDTMYSEVLLLKAQHNDSAGGAPASQQQAGSNRGSKVTSEKVTLVVLCVLLAAAVVGLGLLYNDNMQTKKTLEMLRAECDAVEAKLTNKLQFEDQKCMKCEDGWESDRRKCYYFSTNPLTWSQSRSECQGKGGDLVKIDSKEEQKFLEEQLKQKMTNDEDKFWIGLTDSQEESRWLWVDNSPLEQSFWSGKEPDNWNGYNSAGEDCARMGEKGGTANLTSWFDTSCERPHKRICEKRISGRVTCV
ncbi:hypothetical protein LDENG_00255820 [Lucifuga dentata]|nr:hypothetical protein LDENG_00255820 [Lucifuga dentata]